MLEIVLLQKRRPKKVIFSTFLSDQQIKMVKISHSNTSHHHVTLTENHIITVRKQGQEQFSDIPAEDVQIGDFIFVENVTKEVTDLTPTYAIPANPITENVKIMVNGIAAATLVKTPFFKQDGDFCAG